MIKKYQSVFKQSLSRPQAVLKKSSSSFQVVIKMSSRSLPASSCLQKVFQLSSRSLPASSCLQKVFQLSSSFLIIVLNKYIWSLHPEHKNFSIKRDLINSADTRNGFIWIRWWFNVCRWVWKVLRCEMKITTEKSRK